MRHESRKQQGFTLVEVTIILLVLVILSMIMLPQLGNFNRLARKVKVMEDIGALCATMKKFMDEAMVSSLWESPGAAEQRPSGTRIGLLHGPGKPALDSNNAAFHHVEAPEDPWSQSATAPGVLPINVRTDAPGTVSSPLGFGVDRLENHLMVNDPFGDGGGIADRYKNTSEDALDAVHFFLSWKGPYFDSISEDPWGQRYLVNVFALHTLQRPGTYEYFTSAVVCYSTGPDGAVSTGFNQPMDGAANDYGWRTGGDDFAAILSAGGPF